MKYGRPPITLTNTGYFSLPPETVFPVQQPPSCSVRCLVIYNDDSHKYHCPPAFRCFTCICYMCRACTMQVPSVEIPISLERLSTPCHPSTGPSDVLTRALCVHSIIKKQILLNSLHSLTPSLCLSRSSPSYC